MCLPFFPETGQQTQDDPAPVRSRLRRMDSLEITEDLFMRRQMVGWAILGVLSAVTFAGGAQETGPTIDAKADGHLKAVSRYLTDLRTFSFQVEEFFDVVQDDGQKVQLSNRRKLSVARPGRVFGESEGDTANSQFYYDGKKVTVFDRGHKTYATEKVAGTIDAMLDQLHDKYGVDQPLSDFLFSDPYKVFTEHAQSGAYVGLHHVGSVKCHHLAFRQKILDWQIWIDAGDKPLPRKLLITYKVQAGQPQYTALIHRWDVEPDLSADTFHFEPPQGIRKVDFLKRHEDPGPDKGSSGK